MKKGEITKYILEALAEAPVVAIDLCEAFLTAGYGASRHKIEKNFERARSNRSSVALSELNRRRHNFKSLVSKLKKEGFIEESEEKIFLTHIGKQKLKQLSFYLPSKNTYKDKRGDDPDFKIIIFDIPERNRGKRDWLRGVLCELGFKKLQRSVWAGKKRLPKEFLEDLRELNIIEYIDIFAVTKMGTIRTIK